MLIIYVNYLCESMSGPQMSWAFEAITLVKTLQNFEVNVCNFLSADMAFGLSIMFLWSLLADKILLGSWNLILKPWNCPTAETAQYFNSTDAKAEIFWEN